MILSACASAGTGDDTTTPSSTVPTDASSPSTTVASAPSGSQDDAGSIVDRPTNPLPVEVEDTGDPVEVEIGPDGGTIEVTMQGSTLTLEVPPGALFDPTLITMTPVSVTTEAADLRMIGARLEPDGLLLMTPATLSVDGDLNGSLVQVGFSSGHAGDGLGLTPSVADDAAVSVPHFSIVGVAEATQAELDRVVGTYTPGPREARFNQEMITIVMHVPAGDAQRDAFDSLFRDWFWNIRYDATRAATPDVVEFLYAEFLSAARAAEQREFYGDFTMTSMVALQFGAAQEIQNATHRMFLEANLRCIQDREPNAVFEMLKWATLHEYLFNEGYGPERKADEFEQAVNQCMRFDVVFSSTMSTDVDGVEVAGGVEAIVDLSFSDGENTNFLVSQRTFKSPEIEGWLTGTAEGGELSCRTRAKVRVALDLSLRYPEGGTITEADINHKSVLIRFPEPVDWDCGIINLGEALWFPWFHALWGDWELEEGLYDFPLRSSTVAGQYGIRSESGMISQSEGQVGIAFTVILKHNPRLP